MESISISGRVAPIAKSPLDSARGRRRNCGMVRINEEDIKERLYEIIRESQIQTVYQPMTK